MQKFQTDRFWHGGDYNPDQWLEYPEVLDADIHLMQKAHVNVVSLGIFSWAFLEPEEGRYEFAWLDRIVARLSQAGIMIDLATPSGARPAWLAQKYPEVLRCDAAFQRRHFGERHNHCLTSPVYRDKVRSVDTALARRYAHHPAVRMWHLGNEFGGDCFCPLCAQAFRDWLKARYGSLEELNRRWWTGFWSQKYQDWSQIEPPTPHGEISNPTMRLDWRRFETAQCRSFIEMERDAVQSVNPDIPVTVNMMERFRDYDYYAVAEAVDVVSWDSYPEWGNGDDLGVAANTAMNHDSMRSLKRQPFLLMESTPSLVNWKAHNKLKRPGMHLLSSLQAVAHGSQSVMMFQWRKGRGGAEAFHGAVVSHDGRDDTRVFRDVQQVGSALERLAPVLGEETRSRACILYDYENTWALEGIEAAQTNHMQYFDTVLMYYRALWEKGIRVDFCDMSSRTDLSGYGLVIAPMLTMFRNGIEEKLKAFVRGGGTLLVTYFSGIVDGDRLTWLGDAPHGLTDVLGLRAEEIDALYPQDRNAMVFPDGTECTVMELCELPADVTAEVRARYGEDFYRDVPCLTRNHYGAGEAWYVAAKTDQAGVARIVGDILDGLGWKTEGAAVWPHGVIPTWRGRFLFVQNYSGAQQTVEICGSYRDRLTGAMVSGQSVLPVNGIWVLEKAEDKNGEE